MISTEKDATGKVLKAGDIQQVKTDLHNALLQNWPQYKLLAKKVKDYLNLLPPSAVMAGVYTMIDNTRGVWKAPASPPRFHTLRRKFSIMHFMLIHVPAAFGSNT